MLLGVDIALLDDYNSQFLSFNLGPIEYGFKFDLPEFRVNWGRLAMVTTQRTTYTYTEAFSSPSTIFPVYIFAK